MDCAGLASSGLAASFGVLATRVPSALPAGRRAKASLPATGEQASSSWDGRIRTCGMTGSKPVDLPLVDVPKMRKAKNARIGLYSPLE